MPALVAAKIALGVIFQNSVWYTLDQRTAPAFAVLVELSTTSAAADVDGSIVVGLWHTTPVAERS